MSRHCDLLPHHVSKREHCVIRIDLKELLNYLGVSCLMALFISCYRTTYLGQLKISILLGMPRSIAMRYKCCSLLE
uniref:Acyl-desaturase n=1 Tax=Arundo donax TaxID=35708 RepID=A0A0A9DHF0_ARUDO